MIASAHIPRSLVLLLDHIAAVGDALIHLRYPLCRVITPAIDTIGGVVRYRHMDTGSTRTVVRYACTTRCTIPSQM